MVVSYALKNLARNMRASGKQGGRNFSRVALAMAKYGARSTKRGVKYRPSGSMTTTKKGKRRSGGGAKRVEDVGSTYAFYYMKGHKARKAFRNAQSTKLTFRDDATVVVSSGAGRQRSLDMPLSTFDRAHLTVLFAKIRAVAITQGWTNQANNIKLVLQSCKIKTEVKNQTNDEVQVWIYDCVIKNDDVAGNTPVVDWYNGANNAVDSPLLTVDGFPYATPFQSDFFRENWRVLKVTKLQMKAGAVDTHTFTQKVNKTFSYSKFLNDSDSLFGKLTCRSFVILLGPVGHVAATPTTISYAPAKLDVIQTRTTKCTGSPDNVSYNRYDITVPATAPLVAMTDADETINSIIVA